MRLLYYRGLHPNFGDDLNSFVWESLAPNLFVDHDQRGFLGIGTLIGKPFETVKSVHVFSSGAGYDALTPFKQPHTFWCVRGPLTAKVLNLEPSVAITDGGILAPELLGIRRRDGASRIGVIPHFESLLAGGWEQACKLADYDLINPMNAPRDVISGIANVRLVITESLHGAIIADVLRIPWIAMVSTANLPVFKWCDWTSSVGVPLRMFTIRSPSAAPLLRYGRPRAGKLGRLQVITEDQALAGFQTLSAGADNTHPRRGWLPSPKEVLRMIGTRNLDILLRTSSIRTADMLRHASECEPSLSKDGVSAHLKARLMDRLGELEKSILSVSNS